MPSLCFVTHVGVSVTTGFNAMTEPEPVPVKGDDKDTDPDHQPGPMRKDDPIHYF